MIHLSKYLTMFGKQSHNVNFTANLQFNFQCRKVLELILSELDREEVVDQMHKYLQQVGQETRAGLIPIDKFVINKGLTKNPEDYADAKSQPHVQVALRLKKRGISIRAGDTVPYVICTAEGVADGTKTGFAERAYHPDDVKREGSGLQIGRNRWFSRSFGCGRIINFQLIFCVLLHLDIEWYLSQQVHPPIARLCAPIEGTDTARIADCLGTVNHFCLILYCGTHIYRH